MGITGQGDFKQKPGYPGHHGDRAHALDFGLPWAVPSCGELGRLPLRTPRRESSGHTQASFACQPGADSW